MADLLVDPFGDLSEDEFSLNQRHRKTARQRINDESEEEQEYNPEPLDKIPSTPDEEEDMREIVIDSNDEGEAEQPKAKSCRSRGANGKRKSPPKPSTARNTRSRAKPSAPARSKATQRGRRRIADYDDEDDFIAPEDDEEQEEEEESDGEWKESEEEAPQPKEEYAESPQPKKRRSAAGSADSASARTSRRLRSSSGLPESPSKSNFKSALAELSERRKESGASLRRLHRKEEPVQKRRIVLEDGVGEAAEEGRESDYDNDDVNDFIVDDTYEEEDSDEQLIHQRVLNEQTTQEHADAMEYGEMNEEELLSAISNSRLDTREAFRLWMSYLTNCILDYQYSERVNKDPSLLKIVRAAIKTVEESFQQKLNRWVNSQLWDTMDCEEFRHAIDELPYLDTTPLGAGSIAALTEHCETCNRHHHATHRLTFYGVRYYTNRLHDPWRVGDFIKQFNYEERAFVVGELCHQRIRLFHAMKHYKLHVMLSIRFHLERLVESFQRNSNRKRSKQQIVIDEIETLRFKLTDANADKARELLHKHYDAWELLNSFADEYTGDTRAPKIDLNFLADLQDFDHEQCVKQIFSLQMNRPKQSETILWQERESNRQRERFKKQLFKRGDDDSVEEFSDESEIQISDQEQSERKTTEPEVASSATPSSARVKERKPNKEVIQVSDSGEDEDPIIDQTPPNTSVTAALLSPPPIRKDLINQLIDTMSPSEVEYFARRLPAALRNLLAAKLTSNPAEAANRHK